MEQRRHLTRRDVIKSARVIGMSANFALAAGSAGAQQVPGPSKILVAYFTRTGNTRVIAGLVRRSLGADLFEIEPAAAYPEDYEETVRQAEQERVAGYEPPLKARVANIKAYDTIYLGFPIWGTTAPAVIRSFLSRHDLAGKTLVPLITHGGYGLGSSLAVVGEHAPKARLLKEFSMKADAERDTLTQVTGWLKQAPVGK